MSCGIFSKTIYEIGQFDSNNVSINLSWLRRLIPAYKNQISGVWMPVIIDISKTDKEVQYNSLLAYPQNKSETSNISSPLSCTSNGQTPVRNILQNINLDILDGDDPENGIFCDYCNRLYPEWKFKCENIRAIYKQPSCEGTNPDGLPYQPTCCDGEPVEFTWPPSPIWSEDSDSGISQNPPIRFTAACCDSEQDAVIDKIIKIANSDETLGPFSTQEQAEEALAEWLENNPDGEAEIVNDPSDRFGGGGGCDTRMKTDDIAPTIPYLYNYYVNAYSDFKYMKQFPSVQNNGLGAEKFIAAPIKSEYLSTTNLPSKPIYIDWILKPRMGEIEPTDNETYHANMYSHKMSYSRYLKNNKTCGNFILYSIKDSDLSPDPDIFNRQTGLFPELTQLPLNEPRTKKITSPSDLVPNKDSYTIPHGINGDSINNIFLGPSSNKHGCYWKWNTTSGVLCWYRYFDKDRHKDDRLFPGIDLYISEGEVFFAENDGPEPLPIKGPVGNCIAKTCPSGLKLINYSSSSTNQLLTVIPSGSEFLYISNNIYDRFYNILDNLLNNRYGLYSDLTLTKDNWRNDRPYKDIVRDAAILATSPQYDGIVTDSKKWSQDEFLRPSVRQEFQNLLSDLVLPNTSINVDKDGNPVEVASSKNIQKLLDDWLDRNTSLPSEGEILADGRDKAIEKLNSNTEANSYNHIGYVQNQTGLINSLAHKYGCYIFIPKNTSADITVNKQTKPHAAIKLDFEPVFKLDDTYNAIDDDAVSILSCSDSSRGNTKKFYYDQKFSIANSELRTEFDASLFYNKYCNQDTEPAVISIGGATKIYNVLFNDSIVHRHPIQSDGKTRFETVYSRFPSVSSVLSEEFSDIYSRPDRCNSRGTFTLKEGQDKLLRLKRVYNAYIMNPAIDLVAFHEDGGCYYDSNLLSANVNNSGTVVFKEDYRPSRNNRSNPKIGFVTRDNAIKLYSIRIEKLRDEKNTDCKTLPLDQPCKCWGLDKIISYPYKCSDGDENPVIYKTPNLFTPFLSSKKIPIKSYGGYSEDKINTLLGSFRIPYHPDIGLNIPNASRVADLADCVEKASVTLYNYVYTEWEIKLPKFLPNRSVWVTMTDSLSLFRDRQQSSVILNINGGDYIINPSSQNLLPISSDSGDKITVYIKDSFYTTAIGDQSIYFNCSSPPARITLTFYAIPQKDIINFHIPPLQAQGTLKKCFFHPNTGLDFSNTNNGSSLIFDKYTGTFKFDHEQLIFSSTNSSPSNPPWAGTYTIPMENTNHFSFYSEFNKSGLLSLNKFLGAMDFDKKLKLYLKINNQWWGYEDHKTFGFYNTNNNIQYYGWPSFFKMQYSSKEDNNSPLIPSIPRVPLEFYFFNNTASWRRVLEDIKLPYPYINTTFQRDASNPKKIYIDGARFYFRLFHIFDSRLTKNSTNKNAKKNKYKNYFYLENGKMNITNEDQAIYPTVHKFLNGFIDTSVLSTINKANNIYDLIKNTDLIFDKTVGGEPDILSIEDRTSQISMDASIPVYLINSSNWKDTSILQTYNYNDFPRDIIIQNFITSKSIVFNIKDKFIYDINRNLVKYPNSIKTVIEFQNDIDFLEGSIGFGIPKIVEGTSFLVDPGISTDADAENYILDIFKNGISLTLFATTEAANMSYARDQLIMIDPKKTISAKWSDIYYNTNLDILNDQVRFASLNGSYGPFLYDNMLNHIIANNFMYTKLKPGTDDEGNTIGECYNLSNDFNIYAMSKHGSGNIKLKETNNLYYIHQPFSFGEDYYIKSSDRFNLLKNYSPIIDINLYTNDQNSQSELYQIQSFVDITGFGGSGICMISGINRDIKDYSESSSNNLLFWVNINDKFKLRPLPIKDSMGFYSRSFVISDPYYMYDSISLKNEIFDNIETSDCTSYIVPNINSAVVIDPGMSPFDWSRFAKVFIDGVGSDSYSIYCDTDSPQECGGRSSCSVKQIGRALTKTKFKYYRYIDQTPLSLIGDLDNIEYALGIDAGLYCPLSITGEIPYVVRSQSSEYNPVFKNTTPNNSTQCINGVTYPKLIRGFSLWDDRYQFEVTNTMIPPLPIDILTNEMIFRMIHGSKQNINLDSIDKNIENSELTLNKLLNRFVQYPSENNIESIYEYIPLDYDVSASSNNRIVNGKINFFGNIADMANGKTIQIIYNSNVYTIKYEENIYGDVTLVCPEIEATGILVAGGSSSSTTTTTYIREFVEDNNIGPPNSNSTETVIASCVCGGEQSVSASCGPVGGGTPVGGPFVFSQDYIYGFDAYFAGNIYFCSSWSHIAPKICEANYYTKQFIFDTPCAGVPHDFHGYFADTHARSIAVGSAGMNMGWFRPPAGCGVSLDKCSTPSLCCGNVLVYQYPVDNCHYSTTLKAIASTNTTTKTTGRLVSAAPFISEITIEEEDTSDCIDNYANQYASCWAEIIEQCTCHYKNIYCDDDPNTPQDESQFVCGTTPIAQGYDEQDEDQIFTPCPGCVVLPLCGVPMSAPWLHKCMVDNGSDPENTDCVIGSHLSTYGANNGITDTQVDYCCGTIVGGCTTVIEPEKTLCSEQMNMTVSTSPTTTWELVSTTTTTTTNPSSVTYNPAFTCPFPLGSFIFSNDKIEIVLGNSKIDTNTGNIIANGSNCQYISSSKCPEIEVILPNNNFTISEINNSKCDVCPPSTNDLFIEVTEYPEFDSKILDLEYILGVAVVGGSLDSNVTTSSPSCYPEYIDPGTQCPKRICGQPVEDYARNSTVVGPWLYFTSDAEPWGEEGDETTIDDSSKPVSIYGGRPWEFDETLTNPTARAAYEAAFRNNMTQKYNRIWTCNGGAFNPDDLLSGIIPGSCSLSFQTFSHPFVAVRYKSIAQGCSTRYETEKTSGAVSIVAAVVRYKYKAPKTVIDYIIDTHRNPIIPGSNYCFVIPVTYNDPSQLSWILKQKLVSTGEATNCKGDLRCYNSVVNANNACSEC